MSGAHLVPRGLGADGDRPWPARSGALARRGPKFGAQGWESSGGTRAYDWNLDIRILFRGHLGGANSTWTLKVGAGDKGPRHEGWSSSPHLGGIRADVGPKRAPDVVNTAPSWTRSGITDPIPTRIDRIGVHSPGVGPTFANVGLKWAALRRCRPKLFQSLPTSSCTPRSCAGLSSGR